MTQPPEDALDRHLPDPPQTKTPLSFLEWASAGSGIAALIGEIIRRLFPITQEGVGFILINTIFVVALGLVCIQGIPVLYQELTSKRRGAADYYMLGLLIFCLTGSAFVAQKDIHQHFLGVLPMLFSGYGISKRKYKEYQESLEVASKDLEAGGGAEMDVIRESRKTHRVRLESIKTGDLLRVKNGHRIWVPGIIRDGHGLVNQASNQSSPVPRRIRKGDTVNAGEVLIEGELVIQAAEDGKAPPHPKDHQPDSWLEQFHSLAFNRRQSLLRTLWINFAILIIAAQFTFYYTRGDWQDGFIPAVSLLIGLNPWGIVLILPLLWRRRFTVTAYKGIRFRNLKVVERFNDQLEIVVEKTGVLTEPGISRKKIILSKHFQGKTPFLIRAIRAMEAKAGLSLGAHYFSPSTKEKKVEVIQLLQSDLGTIEAEIFDEEEHRIFIRVGSLRSMPYFTHNGFKQLNAQVGDIAPRQRLFVTLNDVPAAIFVWDERIKEAGIELIKEARKNKLPITLVTKDPRSKLETLDGQPITQVGSAKEKMERVQALQKNNKDVLFIGYGRNDVPALATASASMMMENGDPFALPFADAVLTNQGLRLMVGEWTRFKKARSTAKNITLIAIGQIVAVLTLSFTNNLSPWLATLLTGLIGTVMMIQTLRVEK